MPPAPSPPPPAAADPTAAGLCAGGAPWAPIWADEFDGAALDPAKWEAQAYDGWQFGVADWGNGEWAWYTGRPENVRVEGGRLVLEARREGAAGAEWVWQDCWDECRDRCLGEGKAPGSQELQWCIDGCGGQGRCAEARRRAVTSARLRTRGRFAAAPSAATPTVRVEGRVRLPAALGMWPALWMLPDGGADSCAGCGPYGAWAASGEIDVLEATNNCSRTSGAAHFGGPWPQSQYTTAGAELGPSPDGFHVAALEWDAAGRLRWFVDGELIHTAAVRALDPVRGWFSAGAPADRPAAPFDVPFHLVLNLAVGGTLPQDDAFRRTGAYFSLEEAQAALGAGPQRLEVDWVRVCGRAAL
jgi:hypothetical protein